MKVSESLFPNASALRHACDNAAPESLSLEFKEKSDPTNPIPSKDDRKNIAKSVSAMANSSGGTVVYGVRTRQIDGVDCATEAKPISDIAAFQRQFESIVGTVISPELKSWSVRAILDSATPGSGFLVCDIGTSPERPHMCVAAGEHTYYRRSFAGDLPMTPLEVREQILAVREAQLRLKIVPGGGTFSSVSNWLAVKADFNFLLENVGQRMCKNPFLRIETEPAMGSYGSRDPITLRHKSNFPTDQLLHIGDVLPSLNLSICARILKDQLLSALATEDQAGAWNSIKIYDGNDEIHSRTISDKSEIDGVTLQILFGAENASTKREVLRLDNEYLKRAVFHGSLSSLVDRLASNEAPLLQRGREPEFFGPNEFELQVE